MSSTLSADLFLYQILCPSALQQRIYQRPKHTVSLHGRFFMQYMCKSKSKTCKTEDKVLALCEDCERLLEKLWIIALSMFP